MKHFYLMHLRYLGYRYHGYAVQPNVKTVQKMLEKTINYVLGGVPFKTLASGRTDAMVSAEQGLVELFLEEPIDLSKFADDLNYNLPMDMKLIDIYEVDEGFNVIQTPKQKTYRYYFSEGTKMDPRAAPFIAGFPFSLDVELMTSAAELFRGTHDFRAYCTLPKGETVTKRTIDRAEVRRNSELTASFFPEISWVLEVKGSGFMRNQVRLMMGQLILLGKREITLDFFKQTLEGIPKGYQPFIAPASGLTLHKVDV